MTCLLDANVFLQAKNLHYAMDFCPAFWEWLAKANEGGKVFSIDKVLNELEAGDDALAVWAKEQKPEFSVKRIRMSFPNFLWSATGSWGSSMNRQPLTRSCR